MSETNYFVHETSYIDENVQIQKGTKIWHFCHLMPGSRIGEHCNIGQNVFIGSDVVLGNRVKVQNNVSLYTGVFCEDDVFLGPSMVFTNVINPRAFIERKNEFKTTLIKRGASIGANATIVCGTTIGKFAFIGAGALISTNIPDYALVYGNPGKQRGWVCRCGTKLDIVNNHSQCRECKREYTLINDNELIEK
ncbi:acyltransferase [Syntrophomonas wolfei]|jgi:UDP-2-acetamido-3-amino-2,3-dideoxy-glucuronate N-acetyltransferase|uniref:acyltransferase n=1 Tax=Syntrophomonas wolfei TaxID=863 RepID=UPI0023F3622E|nr:DapH/DapD/GlmU-related protein [Syntrophomonas wolfei]